MERKGIGRADKRMTKENKYEGLTFHGDEPFIDASGILASWAIAWPRAIARVWKLESEGSLSSDKWYQNLISNDQEKVKDALQEMGFISGMSLDPHEKKRTFNWFFDNVKIFVKKAADGVSLIQNMNNSDRPLELLKSCQEDSIDKYQRERGTIKKINQFLEGDILKDTKVSDKLPPATENGSIPPNKRDLFVMVNGWRNIKRYREYKDPNDKNRVTCESQNLEMANKRTEHVVILTIPPKPQDDGDIGLALTDYASAGKPVPFTCFLCC